MHKVTEGYILLCPSFKMLIVLFFSLSFRLQAMYVAVPIYSWGRIRIDIKVS
ncbi:hypothetical protein BDV40DRAFT_255548 [Aspergillus tamarii]|uniref:Uncharacterized protein n=1 Tax=Aspergillus tamarii TaxID=41984 RepID=A0A5N6V932_ASPTM|nr:hypothetical protein BDV40DRAFT_255548 [Aspergillus tamarii]